ncbi:MAG: hypothetical protein MK005_09765 [Alcanivorax sp.]|nr:hypothetical protein [Alcanivorax sp.]
MLKFFNVKIIFIAIFEVLMVVFLLENFVFEKEYAVYSGVVNAVECKSYSRSRSFLKLYMDGESFFNTISDSECDEMKSYYRGRSVEFYYNKKTKYIVEMECKGIKRFSKEKHFYVSLGFCFLVFFLFNGALASAFRTLKKLGFNV